MEKFSLILLLACFVTSLFSVLYQKRAGYLRAFPVYFFVAVSVQIYGTYLGSHGIPNVVLYNVFSALEFSFFFMILRCIIHSPRIRRILLLVALFYPVLAILNIFLYQGAEVFHTLTYTGGCLLIGLFCILYFVELFQMPKAIDLMKSPPFWICTATLVSYICTFPFWGMVNMMTISLANFQIASIVVNIINILTYILFLIAFLCRIRVRKSTS